MSETISASEYRKRVGLPPAGSDREPGRSLARQRRAAAERMNKTEAAYAQYLDFLQRAGYVKSFRFEAITLRLADGTRYTPDFLVERFDTKPELHEVKGFWREDALVKYRVAAELFPMFLFRVVKRRRHEWEIY